jgi:hypothetical protein
MKPKYIAGITMIALGCVLTYSGAVEGNQMTINAGIGGVFVGIVLLSFSTSDYVKMDALKSFAEPYAELCRRLVENLNLKSNAVYIPPYENLRRGGVFIPLYEDFDIDLAKIDEGVFFLTDVGREKEMGLLIPPLGFDLLEMYEKQAEIDFTGLDVRTVENASAVLRSLGLAKSVVVESFEDRVVVHIDGIRVKCSSDCERIACPICGSILLAISKCLGELLKVETFERLDGGVKIVVKRLGDVKTWM